MADPFDSTNSNPDFWRNLMQFGLATMAAGAQPGARMLGALGQGGVAATEAARQNALARQQAQHLGAQTENLKWQNQLIPYQIGMEQQKMNILNSAFGNPNQPAFSGSNQFNMPGMLPSMPSQSNLSSGMQSPPMMSGGMSQADSIMPSLIKTESGGDPNAVSTAGAQGLAQIMPATGASPGYGITPLQNNTSQENIRMGKDYLNAMITKYNNNPTLGLMAYNWGPEKVDGWLKAGADPNKIPSETRDYVFKVNAGMMNPIQSTASESGPPPPTKQQMALSYLGGSKLASEMYKAQTAGYVSGETERAKLPYLEEQKFREKRGEILGNKLIEIDTNAKDAISGNFLLDQMRQQSQTWRMGKFGELQGEANAYLQVFAKSFLDEDKASAFDKPVADFQAFQKNAGQLTRQAVREVSSRAAVQEYTMIQNSLPSANMSSGGFDQIVDQMQSVHDYHLAKQEAAQKWLQGHRTLEGFETEFNKNVSPAVFLINRMNEQDLQAMSQKMRATPGGQKAHENLMNKLKYAFKEGLVQ